MEKYRMTRILPALFLMLMGLVACQESNQESNQAAIQVVPEANLVEGEPFSVPDLLNGVQNGPLLFGGQPTVDELQALATRGYKTVLSVRSPSEQVEDQKGKVEAMGMTFTRISMDKPVEKITDEQVNLFSTFMEQAERPILMHCGSGNRIAGLWAVWLVEHQRMDKAKALTLAEQVGMTDIRPVVERRLANVE